MNDNKDKEDKKVIKFKKKKIEDADNNNDVIASVFLRKGMVGLEIKDGVILLNQNTLISLVLTLLSALKVRNDFIIPQE